MNVPYRLHGLISIYMAWFSVSFFVSRLSFCMVWCNPAFWMITGRRLTGTKMKGSHTMKKLCSILRHVHTILTPCSFFLTFGTWNWSLFYILLGCHWTHIPKTVVGRCWRTCNRLKCGVFLFFLAIWTSSNIFHQPSKQNQLKEVRTYYLFWEIPCCLHTVSGWSRTPGVYFHKWLQQKGHKFPSLWNPRQVDVLENYPPWNEHRPWKMLVGRRFLFGDVNFSGDRLVLGRVYSCGDLKYFTIQYMVFSLDFDFMKDNRQHSIQIVRS